MYTYDIAFEESKKYFNGDELAAKVFLDKYALRDNDDNILELTPDDMHKRLAKEFARIEAKKFKKPLTEEEIYGMFEGFKYLCVTGDNYILTSDGPKLVKSLVGSPFIAVVDNKCYRSVSCGFIKTGTKQTFKINTSEGYSIKTTEEHPIKVHTKLNYYLKNQHTEYKKVKDIKIGEKIVLSNNINNNWSGNGNFNEGWLVGQVIGDGTFNKEDSAIMYFYRANTSDFDIGLDIINKTLYTDGPIKGYMDQNNIGTIASKRLALLCNRYGICKGNKFNLSKIEESASSNFCKGLICGLFDADAHIFDTSKKGKDASIRLGSINLDLLYSVQRILARIGIISKIYKKRKLSRKHIIRGNECNSQDFHELRISKSNIFVFINEINSKFADKINKLDNLKTRNFRNEKFFATVSSIEENGVEDVYDATIEHINSFDCNGIIVHNCPQGSPMYGIGNDYKIVSLSNCYLLDVPQDSYNSILDVDKQLVNISKRRGGVGIDLSELRPKNTPTKNAAKSSTGIVSWMERYSNSIREVGQHSRRGALMLTLSVHHPDIIDFCTIKNDPTKVTGANISVRLTREFLNAVKNDTEYELRWPEQNPKISKMIRAKEVWDIIINSAWLRAEPGLLMWDNVIENTPADCYEEYRSRGTNPCQPSWAKILTKTGIKRLGDINIGDEIWSQEGWTTIINKWSNGVKPVYKFITTGGIFYGTENHKVISNGNKVQVEQAENIEIIPGYNIQSSKIIPEIVMDGLVIGDGSVHKASNNLVHLHIGTDDYDYFNSEIKHLITKYRPGLSLTAYEIITSITHNELPKVHLRSIPDRYIYGSVDIVCSFLRGLYSANGSICGNRITLAASSFQIIEQVQLMLSSIGIKSYWTKNKGYIVNHKNGTYKSKPSYDLNITSDREKFCKLIGFIQNYKNEKIIISDTLYKIKSHDIVHKEYISDEEVFDITVDNNSHTYWTQGCNVSNCSEINLSSLDSCRLLCLNLLSYVKNPFTSEAYFDYALFYEHSQIAQRLMDDMVDLESEKIQAILNKIESDPEPESTKQDEKEMWLKILKFNNDGRRTGTGITALGDTLAALGMKYASEESIVEAEKIYKALKFGCYRSSVDMAKELGPFKCWNVENEKDCKFLLRLQNEALDITIPNKNKETELDVVLNARRPIFGKEIYDDMQKYGRRNIALTTTAPTGSLSILTQTSSGIEPVFMLSYTRRKKINPNDNEARVDFTDNLGDKWQEFIVYHSTVNKWMEITGETDISKSPWFGATANDINWVNRVKLQSECQKHVCHAISSTVNLPEDISKEEVAQIYQTAFESNCKGLTIYRNNCRSGVMVETKSKKDNQDEERPDELSCFVHHTNIKGVPYFVLVGIKDGKPYEVFAGKNGFLDKDIEQGKIIKIKRAKKKTVYKAIFSDDSELSPITSMCTDHEESITRLISTILRCGGTIHLTVQQLEKIDGDMHSFAKGLARILKKYIPNGTEEKGEICPECNSNQLVRQDGCITCKNCGYSKCS